MGESGIFSELYKTELNWQGSPLLKALGALDLVP